MAGDPYKYFRVEAVEIHGELGQGVLDLERGGHGPDLVPRLLRLAHTLKGAARVVKQREIADHAHSIEDALAPFRESTSAVPRAPIEALLQLLDGIGAKIAGLAAPEPAPAPALAAHPPPKRVVPEEAFRAVRANIAEMDTLLEGIGEAHIQLGIVRRSHDSLERARHVLDVLVEQLTSPLAREGLRPGGALAAAKTQALAEELKALFVTLDRGLSSGVDQLEQELRQVRDAAEQMRLVPAGALFTSLERAVRDVAQAQGKSVLFEGQGAEVRLDAQVLGAVQPALVQLVRNAVAHGIEGPTDRRAAGKGPEGRVTIHVSRRGRRVVFSCTDDGRGIDLDAVRRTAERSGVVPETNRELTAEKLLELLLRGGISTSGTITELSGRGIGLDLLREIAERLGGKASARTDAGTGTTIELMVPLSLASFDALLVEASGALAAIPLDTVRQTLRVTRSDVARSPDRDSIVYRDQVIPFVQLARLLSRRAEALRGSAWPAVVVEGARGLVAVGVDRLIGTRAVIQRPLPPLTPSSAMIAGASMDSSGNPQLVLDPDGLVAVASGAGVPPDRPDAPRYRILVIDDSLTTRMLEQSILESAGYVVDLAISGEEAIEKAALQPYALFLVDVEMPGMDGFTFIERTRADPALSHVPCILVTSRASPDDRRRGKEVGARGHIVKGEFDQNELLEQIRKLVAA